MRRFPLRDILTATATRETELKNLQNREQVAFAFGRGIEGPFGSLSFVEVDGIALQLSYLKASESMGNHDSEIVDAGSVD